MGAVALPASTKSRSASCRGFRVKCRLFLFRFLLIDEIQEFKGCLMAKTGVVFANVSSGCRNCTERQPRGTREDWNQHGVS